MIEKIYKQTAKHFNKLAILISGRLFSSEIKSDEL